jgi:uncharacterized protein YbjT (DUF2867 family)
MRVFVAGATGAIGKQLVPRLVAAGHEVHGMTRRESKQAMLHELGAVPVVADALDPDQVAQAVGRAKPDVIVHQLSALAGKGMRGLNHRVAMTNRLHRGDGSPALGRTGGGGAALRGAEQLRLIRAHRGGGEERGGPPRPDAPTQAARGSGRNLSS